MKKGSPKGESSFGTRFLLLEKEEALIMTKRYSKSSISTSEEEPAPWRIREYPEDGNAYIVEKATVWKSNQNSRYQCVGFILMCFKVTTKTMELQDCLCFELTLYFCIKLDFYITL